MSIHGAVIRREQCPGCLDTGHDNLVVYEDGYAKCYACDHFSYDHKPQPKKDKPVNIIPLLPQDTLQYRPLNARSISQETCEHFKYAVSKYRNTPVQVSIYEDAQKLKFPGVGGAKNSYMWTGVKSDKFFGQSLYNKGKKLVVTEGEIDAMSVAQVMGLNWPCVSITNGASGAVKQFKDNLQWLGNFEEIILFFDADEPGQKAAQAVSDLLPGKIKIATYPANFKDANELLMAGRAEDIKKAFWNASEAMPDDIIEMDSLTYEEVMTEPVIGYDLPYTELSDKIHGLRKAELILITSGSGMGKSTTAREIAYKLATVDKLKIANVYLEEGHLKTAQGYIALDHSIPLGNLMMNPSLITKEQFEASKKKIFTDTGMLTMKHFGSIKCDSLIKKLEFFAVGKSVDFIILDHISIVVSGQESDNERKDIDILMTNLRSFIERTGVGVIAIVHLKRPGQGKAFNEGREISLSDLRGSASLEQLTDTVIALEGNQQDEDKKFFRIFRVLKCRLFGEATGYAGCALYVPETGRLLDNKNHNPFQQEKKNVKSYAAGNAERQGGIDLGEDF